MKNYIWVLVAIPLLFTGCGSFTPYAGYCTKVEAASFHAIYLQNDNTLWTWGDFLSFNSGENDLTEPILIAKNIIDFWTYPRTLVCINENNELMGLGYLGVDVDGTYINVAQEPVKLMDNAKSVHVTNGSILVITLDDILYGHGGNEYGSLGLGDEKIPSIMGFEMIMEDVAYVNTYMAETTYIVKKDGTLWGAGLNMGGRLPGIKAQSEKELAFSATPVFIADGVKKVYHYVEGSFYIKNEGTLWTWGKNNMRGIGDGQNNLELVAEGVVDIRELNSGLGVLMEDRCLWHLDENNSIYSEEEQRWHIQLVLLAENVTSFSSNQFGDYYTTTDGKLYGTNGQEDAEYHNLFYLEKMPKNVDQPVVIVQPQP